MEIVPNPITFEWDKGNKDKNFKKHNISNEEAEQTFINELKIILDDEKHSSTEKRYMLWGVTNAGRKLTVIFTLRKDVIRIISARSMNEKERRTYEKIKTNTNL